MTKLNERKIIQIFQKNMGNNKFVSEDVEFFKIGKANFVAKVDTLVESTDIPLGMKLHDAARKSVVACVSDFASKGVKPQYGMVSITIPKKLSKKNIKDIAVGLGRASKEFGFRFVGGDTNEGKEIVIQVSLFGSVSISSFFLSLAADCISAFIFAASTLIASIFSAFAASSLTSSTLGSDSDNVFPQHDGFKKH